MELRYLRFPRNVTTSFRKLRSINGRYDYALITLYIRYVVKMEEAEIRNEKASWKPPRQSR